MLINIIIILATLIICSYFDLKRKTVPRGALYPIVIIGFFANLLLMAVNADPFFRFANLIIALTVMCIGAVAHEKDLLGGADVLLFIGIILMTPVEFISAEFYFGFFFFTCLCGVAYYAVTRLASKGKVQHIKFVPCILVGYIVATFGLFLPQILAAII